MNHYACDLSLIRDKTAWIFSISFKPGLFNLLRILKQILMWKFITTKLCTSKYLLFCRFTVRLKICDHKTDKKIIKLQKWQILVVLWRRLIPQMAFLILPFGDTQFVLEESSIKYSSWCSFNFYANITSRLLLLPFCSD